MIWQSCGRLLLGCRLWHCGWLCLLLVGFINLGSSLCFGRLFRFLFWLLLFWFLLFSFLFSVALLLVGVCFLVFLFWVLFSFFLVIGGQIFLRAWVRVCCACLFWLGTWLKSTRWFILLSSWFVLSSLVFVTSFMLTCFDICGRVMRCLTSMQHFIPCCFVILMRLLVLRRRIFVCRLRDIHFFLFTLVVFSVGSWLFSFSLCFMMFLFLIVRLVLFLIILLFLALLLFSFDNSIRTFCLDLCRIFWISLVSWV